MRCTGRKKPAGILSGKRDEMHDIKLLTGDELYDLVFKKIIPDSGKILWIATSNLKNVFIEHGRGSVSFLELIAEKLREKVSVRILHASRPSKGFLNEMRNLGDSVDAGLELFCCPRNHMKAVISDNLRMYIGSANITGAGVGMKGLNKRNFELGIYTEDKQLVLQVSDYFDSVWMGNFCGKCRLRNICPNPL